MIKKQIITKPFYSLLLTVSFACDEGDTSSKTDSGTEEQPSSTDPGDTSNTAENTCEGGILDEANQICWENPEGEATTNGLTWDDATAYCSSLTKEDLTDWRLPTLEEFMTVLGGTCEEDSTRQEYRCTACTWCSDCEELNPCEKIFGVDETSRYWTSSVVDNQAWAPFLSDGWIQLYSFNREHSVRCVRTL